MNAYENEVLPETLIAARNSITNPEVQEMMKRLSDFGLGIYMPHMHSEDAAFIPLPNDFIQTEEAGKISFQHRDKMKDGRYSEVAWRWQDDGVTAGAVCTSNCYSGSSPAHGDYHKTSHSSTK